MVNLPIAEGMKIKTGDDGKAEVEFENGSTLRIVPQSAVEFRELSLRDSGVKVSTVGFSKGTAYVNFAGTKDDEFTLEFGGQKIALSQAARLRIDLNDRDSSIAVFKGQVEVKGSSGVVDVKKNQTVRFDAQNPDQSKLAKNVQEEAWDAWDNQQNDYHERYTAKASTGVSPYPYGSADLAYYGNFFNYPGYGMMWSPFFTGVGWDPFMDGAWMSYGGGGYGWVSAYPWGWTPYHSGTWVFLPGRGWAWQPGGAWTSVYAQPRVLNAPAGFVAPRAPTSGTSTVLVSRGPASTFSGGKLTLRNNSAGLGVPRGEINHLSKVSEKVETHGAVNQRVQTAAPPRMASSPTAASPGARPASGGRTGAGSRESSVSHSPMSSGGGGGHSAGMAPSAPAPASAPHR